MRATLGLAAIFVGVCLALRIDYWFWLGLGLMIWGLLQLPSERQVRDQFRPLGYRKGPRVTIRACHGHGFGDCSGFDCRL